MTMTKQTKLVNGDGNWKPADFGHHPDPMTDAYVEIERLRGLLCEAHGGLLRALDYRAATPEGLSIKHDIRDALQRTGFTGDMGHRQDS